MTANRLAPLLLALLPASTMTPAAEAATPQSILVLDASGSMWGQIDGRPKIAIARDAVGALLDGWNAGELGLMAYGHRRKGDCADIELLQAVGPLDAGALRRQVDALNPKGMTPISAAVREAAERLRYSEQKATVILVSDGEETCDADPCALGEELERLGVDFTAHVIGFDIREGSTAQAQLRCLAANTGGRYLEARNAGELNEAFGELVEQQATPTVAAREGEPWMVGYALEAETGIPLDPNGSASPGNHDFSVGQTAADCQALCDADARCGGWHYEPTGSYFVQYPRCHLQGTSFAVRLRREGDDWVAGIKPGVKLVLDEAE